MFSAEKVSNIGQLSQAFALFYDDSFSEIATSFGIIVDDYAIYTTLNTFRKNESPTIRNEGGILLYGANIKKSERNLVKIMVSNFTFKIFSPK